MSSSATTTDDGLLSSSVKTVGPEAAPALVFRYTDINNFSFVEPSSSTLYVKERISGTDITRASVALSMASGVSYRLQVRFTGQSITITRDGTTVLTSSSALTRTIAGKAGVKVVKSYSGSTSWDDLTVIKTGLDQVVSYDDFYPYGQVMDGRSYNAGLSDARYKYTEKERDTETGYDYFGARYYDSRVGRWLSVDPLAEKYPGWSGYVYCGNGPLSFKDPNGEYGTFSVKGPSGQTHQFFSRIGWWENQLLQNSGLLGNVIKSIRQDRSVGIPTGLDYVTDGFLGKSIGRLFGKFAGSAYEIGDRADDFFNDEDSRAAIEVDHGIFDNLQERGILVGAKITYDFFNNVTGIERTNSTFVMMVNPEWARRYGYSDEEAFQKAEEMIVKLWRATPYTASLYERLYLSEANRRAMRKGTSGYDASNTAPVDATATRDPWMD